MGVNTIRLKLDPTLINERNLLFLNFRHERLQNRFNLGGVVSLEHRTDVRRQKRHESMNEEVARL